MGVNTMASKRKIAEFAYNGRTTKVYRIPEFNEFEVRQFQNDMFVGNYFSGDRADAIETAKLVTFQSAKA